MNSLLKSVTSTINNAIASSMNNNNNHHHNSNPYAGAGGGGGGYAPPYGNQQNQHQSPYYNQQQQQQQPGYPGGGGGGGNFSPYPSDSNNNGMPQPYGPSVGFAVPPSGGSMPYPSNGPAFPPSNAGPSPYGGGPSGPYPNSSSQMPPYGNYADSNCAPYQSFPTASGQPAYPPSTSAYPAASSSSSSYSNTQYDSSQNGRNVPSQYPSAPSNVPQPATGHMYPNLNPPQQYGPSTGGPAIASNIQFEPTIRPTAGFNAQIDAEKLYKAMKGFGTDEKALMRVLCCRTWDERHAIVRAFKQMYGKDLIHTVTSETSGNFGKLMIALCTPPDVYDAMHIHKAVEGLGTDEDSLVEILCSRSNREISLMQVAYKQGKVAAGYKSVCGTKRGEFRKKVICARERIFSLFGTFALTHTVFANRNMEHDIRGDTSGWFARLMISLLTADRDESPHVDAARARQTAQELYNRGEKRWGTDEAYFNSVLAAQSYGQLRAVFDEYQRLTGHSMEQAIMAEMSGDVRNGMLAIVKCVRNPSAFFAEQLYKSMKGLGTRDHVLIRVLITRCEKDLGSIKRAFHQMHGQSLEQFIKGDTSGDYERGLLALCGVVP